MNTKENQVFSLLLIEHIFSKKTTKQKSKRKRNVWVKPMLKNCMYTRAFNDIFGELIVNDNEEFRRYLRIYIATYHYFFFAWQINRDVSYHTSLPKQQLIQWSHCIFILYCHCCCFCSIFDFYRNRTKMWKFSLLTQCY